jgi:hypothetical protein
LNYELSGGLILSLVFLTVVVALPMKLGAHMANAKRTGIISCGFAAFVGLFAGLLASIIFGGLIGGPLAAAIGFALAIRFMLGTSFFGALGLMLIALLLSFVGFALLAKLGIITVAHVSNGVAI